MRSTAIAFIAAFGCTALLGTSAWACDMSQSMTDPTCANEGFPNVFNNPPPPMPAATPTSPMSPMSSAFSDDEGPTYAYGIFGLLEGAHPTMIYPGRPIICRQGIDCPGDATEPPRQANATAYRHARLGRHADRHRLTEAKAQ